MVSEKALSIGNSTMLILKLLTERDMYGYEMVEELRRRSQNVFEMKAGTLYPLLHTMEDNGYVVPYEKKAGVRKMRKYYRITEEGKKVFEQKHTEWQTYAQAIMDVLGAENQLGHVEIKDRLREEFLTGGGWIG